LQFLPLEDFRDVKIEEVAVEDGLDATGDDGDDVVEALEVVSVNPVGDVEGTIGSESEQVVAGDGLSFASFAHHEQLGQNCHRLHVDREGP